VLDVDAEAMWNLWLHSALAREGYDEDGDVHYDHRGNTVHPIVTSVTTPNPRPKSPHRNG
jgi:hypothetical protein